MNHEKYVFLDESGDLGKAPGSSNHFIITLLVASDPRKLENKLKKYKRKLTRKKKYKRLSEVKASKANDEIRFQILDIVLENDVEIYSIILNKEKTGDILKYGTKVYNYLTSLIIAECNLNKKKVYFVIDKRVKKKIIREDFDNYIKKNHPKIKFRISHLDSSKSNGLQLVDFISWSIFRHYEFKDHWFFNHINSKITLKKELKIK